MPLASPYAPRLAELPTDEHTVELLGSSTRYWSYGPADAALTLVLVHGYRGDHHGLEPVVAQLRGIRVLAPDLPGFGSSTPMTDAAHDIAGYARWLGAFSRALGLGDAVVLGHSFGSIVVSHAVARGEISPPRVVLVNPIASLPVGGVKAAGTRALVGAHRLAGAFGDRAGSWLIGNAAVVRAMSEGMARTRDPELRRWIHEEHARYFSAFSDMTTVLEAFAASVTETVTDAVAVPVLVIGAEQDQIAPAAAVRAYASRLPDASLVMIDGVGHLIHYERPRDAAAALVGWLGAGELA
ncbi:alpha/beta fold hydrolase [Galbitalea sp. SE-J8]|uniref:alpha/beta fold hydrolase n=1 Tax=Galbitalea sp. SE-J8 TaxID=3054952 RepID=UPI00259CB5FC|nr:alpha/beta fold hydrolase [Galbitalea sp. SE-J8]MDM4763147.1 alpha/beta fold hydrolase [Galbitalea sp. SE-J8]